MKVGAADDWRAASPVLVAGRRSDRRTAEGLELAGPGGPREPIREAATFFVRHSADSDARRSRAC